MPSVRIRLSAPTFKNMIFKTVELIFPTGVGIYKDDKGPIINEIDFIRSLEKTNNQYNKISIENYLFELPAMKRIRETCLQAAQDFFEKTFSPNNKECQLYITQSWANFTSINEKHHKHYHPNSIISGVYYINANAFRDKITFFRSSLDNRIEILPKRMNPFTMIGWSVPVETSDIICFPSQLEHAVPDITDNYTRISVSFNTFIKGTIGSKKGMTALDL